MSKNMINMLDIHRFSEEVGKMEHSLQNVLMEYSWLLPYVNTGCLNERYPK